MTITIRQLEPPEWVELQDLLIQVFTEPLPDPVDTRIFAVEETDGTIIGFMQIEAIAHIRHIYMRPDRRGNGETEQLVDHVRGLFRDAGKRAHLTATDPFAEKLAEYAGMKHLPGTLWEGDGS